MTIYVVLAGNRYSCQRLEKWCEGAFLSEESAEEHINKLKEERMRKINRIDELCSIDYYEKALTDEEAKEVQRLELEVIWWEPYYKIETCEINL